MSNVHDFPGIWTEEKLLHAISTVPFLRASPSKGHATYKKWLVTYQGEHFGSLKLFKKTGLVQTDFLYGHATETFRKLIGHHASGDPSYELLIQPAPHGGYYARIAAMEHGTVKILPGHEHHFSTRYAAEKSARAYLTKYARDPMKKSAKFERCVRKVKAKRSRVNPWAVCHTSLKRDPPHSHRGYIVATDSFISGWGGAAHGRSLLAIAVHTEHEAHVVTNNLKARPEMKRVRYVHDLKTMKLGPHDHLSIRTKEDVPRFFEVGGFGVPKKHRHRR